MRRCRYKTLAIASIVAALLLAEAGGLFLNRPPNIDCLPEASGPQRITEARAIKTVVRPWRGPHHVYGLFVIPSQFVETKRYAVTISVEGMLHYCMWVERSSKERRQVISAEPGGYLVQEYVPTRVAMWFLINGRLGDLRRPENWAIVFSVNVRDDSVARRATQSSPCAFGQTGSCGASTGLKEGSP